MDRRTFLAAMLGTAATTVAAAAAAADDRDPTTDEFFAALNDALDNNRDVPIADPAAVNDLVGALIANGWKALRTRHTSGPYAGSITMWHPDGRSFRFVRKAS